MEVLLLSRLPSSFRHGLSWLISEDSSQQPEEDDSQDDTTSNVKHVPSVGTPLTPLRSALVPLERPERGQGDVQTLGAMLG